MFSQRSSDHASVAIGPVRCAWRPHRHGTPAETQVRPWLAQQLKVDIADLRFDRDARGRPQLGSGHGPVDASWSHSGDSLLVALGRGVRVGVDLELLRPHPRAQRLAERFFTAAEAAALAALPDATRESAFVQLWCAKEAVLKAHGVGLAFGLHRLAFARDGDDWRLVDCDPALGSVAAWTLRAFVPASGYLAALAWRPLQVGAPHGRDRSSR
ncbi:MAG: 4'-phosphopantetheinyl transferase family protein [Luteimonas sp.]